MVETQKQRSRIMGAVRSKNNLTTEIRLKHILMQGKNKGWRRHLKIPGTPDFSFCKQKVAVFVDGCFWHGCPKCFRLPKQNRFFWKTKIEGNQRRDRSVNGRLRRMGWKVIRIRECQLKNKRSVLEKIKRCKTLKG